MINFFKKIHEKKINDFPEHKSGFDKDKNLGKLPY